MDEEIQFSDFFNGLQKPMRALLWNQQTLREGIADPDLMGKIKDVCTALYQVSRAFTENNIPLGTHDGEMDDEYISTNTVKSYFFRCSVPLTVLNELADLLNNQTIQSFMSTDQEPTKLAHAATNLYRELNQE